MSEHWFDELAQPQTRGRMLKRMLAAAALTLPLAPVARAATRAGCQVAATPDSPFRQAMFSIGCVSAADKAYTKASAPCDRLLDAGSAQLAPAVWLLGHLGSLGNTAAATLQNHNKKMIAAVKCYDLAVMRRDSTKWDCIQPGWAAANFDPCSPNGACEICSSGTCCPDERCDGGFCCCTPNGGCCKPDGCHSGVTDCGNP